MEVLPILLVLDLANILLCDIVDDIIDLLLEAESGLVLNARSLFTLSMFY